jgi:hypothetical protein
MFHLANLKKFQDGNCALIIAAKYGYSDIVVALLEKGAYVNTPNKVNLI